MVSASLGGLEVLAFKCVFRWEIGPFSTLVSLACPTSPNPFLWTSPKKIGTDSFLIQARSSFSLFDSGLLRKIGGTDNDSEAVTRLL